MFWDVGLEKQPINDKPNNTHSPRKKEEGDTEETAKREREVQTIEIKLFLAFIEEIINVCMCIYYIITLKYE